MQSYVNSFRVQIYRMWFMSSHDCRVLTLHCNISVALSRCGYSVHAFHSSLGLDLLQSK